MILLLVRKKIAVIADDAGMSVADTQKQMSEFVFPTNEQQLNEYFNPGGVADIAIEIVGNAFATPENPALDDYGVAIDTSFLK